MINRIMYLLQRPEKGWDPVPSAYASEYADAEYQSVDKRALASVLKFFGDIRGKTLLDLGGGPGQYTLSFAECGAITTWHDISLAYQDIAKKRNHNRFPIIFSLGYLEEVKGEFDFLFSRICWCYCLNDYGFARLIFSRLKKNGKAYVISNNELFVKKNMEKGASSLLRFIQFILNDKVNLKIGHPHPSHEKLKKVFAKIPFTYTDIQRKDNNTIIKVIK